ncbi:MAG TPA: VTT domain-containing protein [Gemmatimonadaceae bacterium]
MESLEVFIRTYGYPALFGGMVMEQFVPPMPGEPLLLGAGALAGTGYFRLWFAAAFALAGTVVGDLVWYEIGRQGGRQVLKRLCRLSIEPDTCVRRGEDTFARRGASALLIAKFLPGLNSIGQPLAGALGMPRQRFVIFDVLGAVLWVGLYVGLGFALHDQLAEAALLAERLGGWALVIVAVAFGLYLGIKVIRRQLFIRELRIARISPEELEAQLRANEPVFVVDLRHELEVVDRPMMIRGAVRITPAALEQGRITIPRDREVVLYCS